MKTSGFLMPLRLLIQFTKVGVAFKDYGGGFGTKIGNGSYPKGNRSYL